MPAGAPAAMPTRPGPTATPIRPPRRTRPAHVAGLAPRRCLVAHHEYAVDVLGVGCETWRKLERGVGADTFELTLGIAESFDHAADAIRQIVPLRLHHLCNPCHEHMLAREIPVGVSADKRLDPPDPGADGELTEKCDETELAGAGHVRAA